MGNTEEILIPIAKDVSEGKLSIAEVRAAVLRFAKRHRWAALEEAPRPIPRSSSWCVASFNVQTGDGGSHRITIVLSKENHRRNIKIITAEVAASHTSKQDVTASNIGVRVEQLHRILNAQVLSAGKRHCCKWRKR